MSDRIDNGSSNGNGGSVEDDDADDHAIILGDSDDDAPPGDNPVLFTLPWSKDPNYNEIITMRLMSNLQALPGFKHHHGFKEQKDAASNTSLSSSVRRGRQYYVSVHPSDIKLLDPIKKPMLNDCIVNAVIIW